MATSVNIEVLLDDSGVVSGVQRVQNGVHKMGQDGSAVFQRLSRDVDKSRGTTEFLAESIGIRIPRAMQRMLSELPLVADGLSAAFNAGVVALFIVAIASAINNLDVLKKKAYDTLLAIEEARQRVWGAFTGQGSWLADQKSTAAALKATQGLTDAVDSMWDQAKMAGKEGVAAISLQAEQMVDRVRRASLKVMSDAKEQYGEWSDEYKKVAVFSAGDIHDAEIAAAEWKNQQLAKLRRDDLQDIRKKEAEANSIMLTGTAAVVAQERVALQQIDAERAKHSEGWAEGEAAAIRAKTTGEIEKMGHDWREQIDKLARESFQAGTTGIAAIEVETENKIAALREEFIKQWGETFVDDPSNPENIARWNAWMNAEHAFLNGIEGLRKAAAERIKTAEAGIEGETRNAEQAAGTAGLPIWLRGLAGTQQQRDETLRQIDQWEKEMLKGLAQGSDEYVFIEEEAQRRRMAAWNKANNEILDQMRQVRDQLAGELESVFDDITSGNIGKRILSEIKHLFFQIVAQWILAMNSMRGASGGLFGGSILGSIFGGLFGLGGASGGGSNGGYLGTPPFFGNMFGGGSSSGSMVTVGAGTVPLFGGLSAGAGSVGATSSQAGGMSMTNTVLGGLMSKIFTHGIGSGKFGLSGQAVGMLGAMVGLESIMGAYSSGNPVLGGIGGAAGGALMGFSIGGPVGAAIGAVVGALAGVFGGILGGRKKEHQAEDMVAHKYAPAIKDVEDAFASFQIQYQDALDQLDQIDKQAQQELHQLGGIGDHRYRRDIPWRIAEAKKQIQTWQDDRTARGAVDFGAPLFDSGGLVGLGSGHQLIVARNDEFVVNPYATRRNRATLERINAGGDTPPQVNIIAWDGASVDRWLRNGGARKLRNALRGQDLEYSGEGIV